MLHLTYHNKLIQLVKENLLSVIQQSVILPNAVVPEQVLPLKKCDHPSSVRICSEKISF